MTTFIKTKLNKSYNETNIGNFRVAENITEYQSNLIFGIIIIQKLFHVKMSKLNMFKMNVRTFLLTFIYRVATFSKFYPTVSGIIMLSLKSKERLYHA